MCKIFLAEDEKWLREKLKQQISSFSEDFTICGEAETGDEAISKLKNLQPDILITDIKMPGRSGLEVAKFAKEQYPNLSCIMISGFDKFEYAQEALQIGSIDYLLKPVESDQLLASIQKAMETNHHARIRSSNTSLLSLEPNFKSALEGEPEEMKLFTDKLMNAYTEFRSDRSKWIIIVDDEINRDQLQKLIWTHTEGIVIHMNNRTFTILALLPEEAKTIGIESWLRQFTHHIRQDFKLNLAVGSSETFQSWDQLHDKVQQAYQNYSLRFYEGDGWIGVPQNIPLNEITKQKTEYLQTINNEIIHELDSGNVDKLDNRLEHFFVLCKQDKISVSYVHTVVARMIRHIMNRFDEEQLLHLRMKSLIPMQWVQKRKRVIDLEDDLKEIMSGIIEFQDQYHGSVHSVIGRVQYMIQHEYHRSDLSITEIAERMHFNQSYLSHLFKKKTGILFNQYLSNLRMEKAKQLLKESHLKTYEVAYSIGYKNEKAFSRAFKKMVGHSPMDYRRNVGVL